MYQAQSPPNKAQLLLSHEVRLREWDQKLRSVRQQLESREQQSREQQSRLNSHEALIQQQRQTLEGMKQGLITQHHAQAAREGQLQERIRLLGQETHQLQERAADLERREQQFQEMSCELSNPRLDHHFGPGLEEATERLYLETGEASVARIRAVEGLAQHLRELDDLFGQDDQELFKSLFTLHHPCRSSAALKSVAKSFHQFCQRQRQERGERIAAERTPALVQTTHRPGLKRRHSWVGK